MLTIFYMEVSQLYTKKNYDRSLAYIDESRKEKVFAARQEKNKVLSLAAGLLISYAVLIYLKKAHKMEEGVFESDFQKLLTFFEKEPGFWWEAMVEEKKAPYGKPYLANHPELFFSVSHSGDFAIVVLSDQEVGADIQKWRHVSSSVEKRLLHEQEPIAQSEEQLFSLWTAKEAYVKCTGEGLKKDFRKLHTDFQKGCVTDMETGMSLPLIQLDLMLGYSVSICVKDTL